ncbi:MAG TPA: glycerophosphodiester phosphodiesterase [Gaiellaceae bacterium]|nr:glycerophosphodiester phosphodiesterase [Gaiellaceae bacterium]
MIVIAHRGASSELPENTLPAFERAIELGADFVEFDVRARQNGELVVAHDPPGGRAGLPALAEVLDLCRGRIGVMVELKTPYRYRRHRIVERTLALLDKDAVVVCFEPGAIARVRALRPELRTVQHVAFVPMRLAAARGCWAVGFENRRASPRAIRAAQRLGLATTVYTVNDEARLLELAAIGVTGVFTDRPRQALACVARSGADRGI